MNKNEVIDQSELAESIGKSIKTEFTDCFLVKPLDPIKVKKEFSKPVSTGEKTDKAGITAEDFDKVETEVKEVDSDYRKGVVIKVPTSYQKQLEDPNTAKYLYTDIKPGTVVVFRETAGQRYDLLKDSRLLRMYDLIGFEK